MIAAPQETKSPIDSHIDSAEQLTIGAFDAISSAAIRASVLVEVKPGGELLHPDSDFTRQARVAGIEPELHLSGYRNDESGRSFTTEFRDGEDYVALEVVDPSGPEARIVTTRSFAAYRGILRRLRVLRPRTDVPYVQRSVGVSRNVLTGDKSVSVRETRHGFDDDGFKELTLNTAFADEESPRLAENLELVQRAIGAVYSDIDSAGKAGLFR